MTTDLITAPKGAPAADTSTYSKLAAMPRKHRVVDYPRLNADGRPVASIAIRPLTQNEAMNASAAADAIARAQFKDKTDGSIGYTAAYSAEKRIQELLRAIREADDPERPAFPSAKAMRETCTRDECGALVLMFEEVSEQLGPVVLPLSVPEIDAYADRAIALGKDAGVNELPRAQLYSVTLALAARLAKSQTPPPSNAAPAGATEHETSAPAFNHPDLGGLDVVDVGATADGGAE